MKKKIRVFNLLFIAACFCCMSVAHAQSYNKLWGEIEKAQKKSLPQTVIQLSNQIFQKGERERNTPQMLKAYLCRATYQGVLTPDSFYLDLKGLEQWATKEPNWVSRAILNTLIAHVYGEYALNHRWELQKRAALKWEENTLPDDIREWSANLFVGQVLKYASKVLNDSTALLQTSSRTYVPFTVLGDASEYYHHDMYHLLASQSIRALEQVTGFGLDSLVNEKIAGTYQRIIESYQRMPESEDAFILSTLNSQGWANEDKDTSSTYLNVLNQLISNYASREVCAEVYLAKARYYIRANKQPDALKVCDEAIRLYPKYLRISALQELRESILQAQLNLRTEKVACPGDSLTLQVSHKNLDGFILNMFRINESTYAQVEKGKPSSLLKKSARKVLVKHFALLRSGDYQSRDTTYRMQMPEAPGYYVVQVIPEGGKGSTDEQLLSLTHFKVLTRGLSDKKYEAVALDSHTGQPIPDAWITFCSVKGDTLKRLKTNAEGKVSVDWNPLFRTLIAAKGVDTAMLPQRVYFNGYQSWVNERKVQNNLTILTDRSIYRPGQTIYIKGVAYAQQRDTADVIANKAYSVTLRDANNKEMVRKEVRTNDFGSFSAEFMLPSACLGGRYSIEVPGTDGGRTTVQVEEYKRPTFEIVFDSSKKTYQIGDSVQVTGKVGSFSGVPMEGLSLSYVVSRKYNLYWGTSGLNNAHLASGKVVVGKDGMFAIPVRLEGTNNNDVNYTCIYQVEATVTNRSGETQNAFTRVMAGDHSVVLSLSDNDPICKDDTVRMTFIARNLNQEPVELTGKYQLVKMEKSGNREILSDSFVSNKEVLLPAWRTLPSGIYQLLLSAKDDQGRNISFKKEVVLFSYMDNHPADKSNLWFYARNLEFDATHPAQFSIGTFYKDAYVMVDVFSGDRRLETSVMQLSDSIVRIEKPYLPEYGSGMVMLFTFVKGGEVYSRKVELKKRLPEKTLKMRWETFRDKLRPGQQEEWKLLIMTPQGKPADAEMLAAMYDASLDKLYPNRQGLFVIYPLYLPVVYWGNSYVGWAFYNCSFPMQTWKTPSLIYDSFCQSGFSDGSGEILYAVSRNATLASGAKGLRIRGVSLAVGKAVVPPSTGEDASTGGLYEEEVVSMDHGAEDAVEDADISSNNIPLRSNFKETAFFYPQLRTNEKGEIALSFVMPESLTRWNFRGYAHTRGMLTGRLDASVVASKEFMLSPNLPRFVRVGDQTSIAATIANLTGNVQKGKVKFELFDPVTEKVLSTQSQSFKVDAGKTIPVNFGFAVTDNYQLLGVRMVAAGGTFSDGEQHLLPVLSNKEYITETLALPVGGKETRIFPLDSLFNRNSSSATNRKLTVEFTGNPAWYAVQALPALAQPINDNAVSWATAYYANTLAAYILNSNPRIKTILDGWRLHKADKEVFWSELQKNQDVKNILLEASPWLLEANTEAERKARILTLFDLNNLSNAGITALTKLKELQNSEGAWSWYRGMYASHSMTEYITELFVRLSLLTGKDAPSEVLSMEQKAFDYLHKAAFDEYRDMLKAEKNGSTISTLSDTAMNYLYLIAISGEKVPPTNEKAYRYFLSKVNNNLEQGSISCKAKSAIILHQAGRKADAGDFIASIKEHLVQTDERGTYFAFNETPYRWGMWPVSVQVEAMEALSLVEGNGDLIEEMKVWLLKQKQVTNWKTPVATADAVYALLCHGNDLLANLGDVRITLGKKVMKTLASSQDVLPGLASVRETFTENSPEVKAKSITIEKLDDGIAWGAVYAQYLEAISQVKQHGGELGIEKQLYVERTLANGSKQLQRIVPGMQLSVGDKVISRLVLRLDRAMDFVQLKDQRGACFEPVESISGYHWNHGAGYYLEIKDASSNFFFDHLDKGVHVLESGYHVARAGEYESGLAIVQSAYAPEYAAHSTSMKVKTAN